MKRNHKYALVLATVLLGAVGVYSAPYVVLWRMRQAVEDGDAAAISSHVNFPRLRESLKASFSAAMVKNAAQQESTGAAALGVLLAGALVDRMVDAMVTPEAVAMLLRGQKPSANGPVAQTTSEVTTAMGYEDLSTFVVTMTPRDQPESVAVVFTREGLSWQLSAVRLPM